MQKKNPEKSSTRKIGEHVPFGYLMSTIGAFEDIDIKNALYRAKSRTKSSLREHAKNILKRKICYR